MGEVAFEKAVSGRKEVAIFQELEEGHGSRWVGRDWLRKRT